MNRLKLLIVFMGMILIILLAINCGNTPTNSDNAPALKTSQALMKAITSTATMSEIPVSGGNIVIQTALINIVDLVIEENSGDNNDQNGEVDEGDQENDQEDDNDNVENEQEGEHEDNDQDNSENSEDDGVDDILAPGPFNLDISSSQANIGSFDVYAGTFKQIDFTYHPVDGKSVMISGEFTVDGGSPVEFSLESGFADQVQMLLANGGITVASDTTVEVTIVFDLANWLADLDFSNAEITDGKILINSSINTDLLTLFETKLAQYVDIEEDGDEED